ncbi:MAG: hypothetical protein NTW21_26730 [Verrucomicrobia bacterium]|nr:hypothetical protein [Verrucomicrobiota bacterium]
MKHPIHQWLLAIAATTLPFNLCPAQDAKPGNVPAPQGFECPKIDKTYVYLPHFSPRRGCITDLNGAIHFNGEYHI